MRHEQVIPDVEEFIEFWRELWDYPVDHDKNG